MFHVVSSCFLCGGVVKVAVPISCLPALIGGCSVGRGRVLWVEAEPAPIHITHQQLLMCPHLGYFTGGT